jgi:hypothetical protein
LNAGKAISLPVAKVKIARLLKASIYLLAFSFNMSEFNVNIAAKTGYLKNHL